MEFEGTPAVPATFGVKDISAAQFIAAYAAYLKKSGKVTLPKDVDVIKTGVRKELAPYDPDWYYIRMAAIARRVYIRGGLGAGGLARVFGGANRKSCMPQHFEKDAQGLIRHILIQLEKNGVVETIVLQHTSGSKVTAGRNISSKGKRELDRVARSIAAAQ